MSTSQKKKEDYLEKDSVKNKVAGAILELSRNTDLTDIPDALIEVAGKRALANLCFFTISPYSDGGPDDGITIYAGFKGNIGTKHVDREGLIGAILPDDCASCCEYTWEFNTPTTVEQAAKKLQAAGFLFDEKMQNGTAAQYTARIKKALNGTQAKGPFNGGGSLRFTK